MKSDRLSILQRLQQTKDVDELVIAVLADERTQGDPREPDLGATVHQTLGIWRRRLRASETSGRPLYGADQVVARLSHYKPQQAKLRQINFRNADFSCVLFFEWTSERFLGGILSKQVVAVSAGKLPGAEVNSVERDDYALALKWSA